MPESIECQLLFFYYIFPFNNNFVFVIDFGGISGASHLIMPESIECQLLFFYYIFPFNNNF
ncbi:hypothetical protein C7D72_30000, partial [Klebsiella pneumoniae]